jgi:hypothetical protein
MKKVVKYLSVILGGLAAFLSCQIFACPWKDHYRKQVQMPTLQPSVSLKTDSVGKQESELNSSMIHQQEDYMNGQEEAMWMICPTSLFDAIRCVETGGCEDPSKALGDNGLSLGPYQISTAYWQDAQEHEDIGGRYEDVCNEKYAEKIMMNYWDRYAPDDSFETLARIHNGGPNGHRKSSTFGYWNKINRELHLARSS